MKPRIKKAATLTPDGGEMTLYQHDRDFSIVVNGEDLMHNRRHESELALARLGGNRGRCPIDSNPSDIAGRAEETRMSIGILDHHPFTRCQLSRYQLRKERS